MNKIISSSETPTALRGTSAWVSFEDVCEALAESQLQNAPEPASAIDKASQYLRIRRQAGKWIMGVGAAELIKLHGKHDEVETDLQVIPSIDLKNFDLAVEKVSKGRPIRFSLRCPRGLIPIWRELHMRREDAERTMHLAAAPDADMRAVMPEDQESKPIAELGTSQPHHEPAAIQQKPQPDLAPQPKNDVKRYKKKEPDKLLAEWVDQDGVLFGKSSKFQYHILSAILDLWKRERGEEYLFVKLRSKAKIEKALRKHFKFKDIKMPDRSQFGYFISAWLYENAPDSYWENDQSA